MSILLRMKKCHWGDDKDIPIKGHILFEDDILYDVDGDEREKILKYTPGLWFDNDNNCYKSFEIIE